MTLVRIGTGTWEVLVTEQVVDVLTDFRSAKGPKKAMLSFLRESVPMGGPQESNKTVCVVFNPRSLKLAEFRKGQIPGTRVRVIWFYADDNRRRVVCVRAFTKNDESTPPGEIPAASGLRDHFFLAESTGGLTIEDLPQPREPKNEHRRKTRKGNSKRSGRC
jgi:hypothetical protein